MTRITFVSAWGLRSTSQNSPEMNLAKELERRGHDLLGFGYGTDGGSQPGVAGSEFRLHIQQVPHFVKRLGRSPAVVPNPRRLSGVMRAVGRNSTDVWHLHHPSSLCIAASLSLGASRGVPVVFTSHDPLVASGMRPVLTRRLTGIRLWNLPKTRIVEVAARSIPYLLADRIIALTDFERRSMVSYGLDPKKIVVIPHGIHPLRKRTGLRARLGLEGKLIVLTVARFVEQKGHRYLIEAIPTVVKRFDAHFVMIGSQAYNLPQLRDLIRELKVEDRVTILTGLGEEEIAEAYNDCDVFVLPSLYESFGIVLLEAMAAEKPVIATDVGGVSEIVMDGRTGLLRRPADPAALAEALSTLLRNGAMRRELGSEAKRQAYEKFAWERVAERTEQVYEELTSLRFTKQRLRVPARIESRSSSP